MRRRELPSHTLHCTARYCISLYCTVLHFTALHCTALHFPELHCTAQYSIAFYCTALHCTSLHCTVLHSKAFHCTALCTLHFTVLHCTTQQITALHCLLLNYTASRPESESGWKTQGLMGTYARAIWAACQGQIAARRKDHGGNAKVKRPRGLNGNSISVQMATPSLRDALWKRRGSRGFLRDFGDLHRAICDIIK